MYTINQSFLHLKCLQLHKKKRLKKNKQCVLYYICKYLIDFWFFSTSNEEQYCLHRFVHVVFPTTFDRDDSLPRNDFADAVFFGRICRWISNHCERRCFVSDLLDLLHCPNQFFDSLQKIGLRQTFNFSFGHSDYVCFCCNQRLHYPDDYQR